ncbi:hypothetical protein QQM79_03685 [Marinobacteraceae bacterium S3BR75-40.1]
MSLARKFLRWGVVFTIVLAVIAGGWWSLLTYDNWKRDQARLNYASDVPWQWHKPGIQVRYKEPLGRRVLRKVRPYDDYVVEAWLADDYSLVAAVKFIVDCEPYSTVPTGKQFSDGEPIELKCNKQGTQLVMAAQWPKGAYPVRWENDFGGFAFQADFRDWDFKKLKQEVTLSRAKPARERTTENLAKGGYKKSITTDDLGLPSMETIELPGDDKVLTEFGAVHETYKLARAFHEKCEKGDPGSDQCQQHIAHYRDWYAAQKAECDSDRLPEVVCNQYRDNNTIMRRRISDL